MKKRTKFRDSVTLGYSVLSLGVLIAWITSLPNNQWPWVVIGGICGISVELISNRYRQKRKKASHSIEVNTIIGCGILLIFSKYVPVMLDLVFGCMLMVTLTQVYFQFLEKRVITWRELREYPD